MNDEWRDFKDNVAIIQVFSNFYSNTILSFPLMKLYARVLRVDGALKNLQVNTLFCNIPLNTYAKRPECKKEKL